MEQEVRMRILFIYERGEIMDIKKEDTNTKVQRRRNGEGTIRLRKDGRWEFKVLLGKIDGKSKYKYLQAKTERELNRKIREYNSDRKKFNQVVDNTPFWEMAEHWMHLYKFPRIRSSSRDRMETTYQCHIRDELGFIPWSKITCDDLQLLINKKSQELSYSYVKKIFQFLNGFFKHMKNRGLITINPCDAVELPREENMEVQTKPIVILDDDEIKKLYDFCDSIAESENHFYKHAPAIVFILNTGIRCGEALALDWDSIDFEKKECTISKNLSLVKQRDKNWKAGKREKLVAQTKTESSKRVIPLNEKAITALEQIKAYNNERGISTNHVISSESGDHITERNLFRTLECICGAAGIKRIGIHGLRHTFASTLIRRGVEVSIVSNLLGHRNISTTYNRYVHVIMEQKKNIMSQIPSI